MFPKLTYGLHASLHTWFEDIYKFLHKKVGVLFELSATEMKS